MTASPLLRLAAVGCGARTYTYLSLAARMPNLYSIEGAADPIPGRVERIRLLSDRPGAFHGFQNGKELLAAGKFADVVIIGTQDADHVEPCLAAMEKGYDILLEKPIATSLSDVLRIGRRARELNRKVLVCHVLRYTPFYRKIKELLDAGEIGKIVSVNATEGVGAWHQAHSYVRGKWAVMEKASPMIIAKSCHDLDIISWVVGAPCTQISSFGSLSYFRKENAPPDAPKRCTDGCPVGETCPYNALLYLTEHRKWLGYIMDHAESASESEIIHWLQRGAWGRCVYHCDNTAVDHQVVSMAFEGGVTATFTMTAFENGRRIEIFGARGVLQGTLSPDASSRIQVKLRDGSDIRQIDISSEEGAYAGHGGGDEGLMMALSHEMNRPSPETMSTSLTASVQSHVMGFAAEASRLTGRTILLDEFLKQEIPVALPQFQVVS